MSDLKQLSALTALNHMMTKGHFSICTIDNVAELLEVDARRSPAYKILMPLHCVDWAKMPSELREAVPGLIQECLGIAPVFQFRTAKAQLIDVTPGAKPSGLLRMLGLGRS